MDWKWRRRSWKWSRRLCARAVCRS